VEARQYLDLSAERPHVIKRGLSVKSCKFGQDMESHLFAALIDGVDGLLPAEFGGETAFLEETQSVLGH
jgi:hypothetical protein